MGRLRDRMDEELRLRGYGANNRECYLRCVRDLVRHFMLPDQLTLEHIPQYCAYGSCVAGGVRECEPTSRSRVPRGARGWHDSPRMAFMSPILLRRRGLASSPAPPAPVIARSVTGGAFTSMLDARRRPTATQHGSHMSIGALVTG